MEWGGYLMETQPLWPWQPYAIRTAIDLVGRGALSLAITSPTGMGKGKILEGLALHFLNQGQRVALLSNRRLLTRQTGDRFAAAGINYGYVSAEHGMDICKSMLIVSVQTLTSRVKSERMVLPNCGVLLVDECHNCIFDNVIAAYRKLNPGVVVIGLTASPIGLKDKYDHLIIAGTKKDGRSSSPAALVPCLVYAPSEPDMAGVKMTKIGEYEHNGMVKRVMQCTVFSDVFDSWWRHGGPNRPTILWAPGVPESKWFAEEFQKRGITAAHIDGETTETERERIREGSRSGDIQVVSSFGVLREGIDWPWLSYGILVQVCGGLGTFVQTVGRLLRSFSGKSNAILQDHSGTWWRHGSPNDDVNWSLDSTNKKHAKERKAKVQEGELSEPICCPQCGGIRTAGPKCVHCGYEHTRSVRMVRMVDGQLVRMVGTVWKKKREVTDDQRHWTTSLYRCGQSGRTLSQALGLCIKELGHPPVGVYPWIPNGPDWDQRVADLFPRFGPRIRTSIRKLIGQEMANA